MLEIAVVILDFLILAWLIGTWFYEGHHRRCTVIARCPNCGAEGTIPCASGNQDDPEES